MYILLCRDDHNDFRLRLTILFASFVVSNLLATMLWLAMPTVLRIGKYRFFFYSGDGNEPPHVHVEYGDNVAKVWLNPVRIQNSGGFNRADLNKIFKMVRDNSDRLLEAWNEYFNS